VESARDDWNEHWQAYHEATAQNPAARFRRRIVERLLPAGVTERILDIGSGQGDLALHLSRRFPRAQMLGLEYSASGVAISRRKLPSAIFLQCDLLADEPPPAEYSSWATRGVCSEVLEHVDDPLRLLRNALRYCAPGCRLVVTVPGGPMSAFDQFIGHRKHYATRTLRGLLEEAGLHVERVAAMGFPVFNLYRLAVIARGDKLIQEVASGGNSSGVSAPARLAMRAFRGFFAVNPLFDRWGWQIAAVARLPYRPAG